MGDRDDYKSKKYKEKSRKRKRYDDDDDYKDRKHYENPPTKQNLVERILTPGQTTNNLIKTGATGMIIGGTIILMLIYGFLGENIAGAHSYLPMLTALSAAAATASVWAFGRPKSEDSNNAEFRKIKKELRRISSDLDQLEDENAELEQRLSAVEMLESFEDKLAKRTLEQQNGPKGPKSAIESDISDSSTDNSAATGASTTETE